ncbi:MAG: dTMP kinase, partial [Candidatus Brockarchaeota archaeon]|nr:dTMP kinase [Candidatus Brockarchaeota archaeon]
MSLAENGVFIVIDGIDGCGKTLHSKSLCRELRRREYDAVYTKEPSYGFVGKFIREKIL